MSAPSCPTRTELDLFQAGDLDEVALGSVASHVESCPTCQRMLETIIGDSEDPVLAALLAEPVANPFADEIACRNAIQRAAALAEGAAPVERELAPTISLRDPPASAESEALPLESIREYKLLAKLGEGGMGAVYKALHTRLDKVVALKVLPADRMRDTGSVARFQREMKAVGRLDHPHIVRAMDAGEENGTHFLVMEYVAGIDLSQLANHIGRLPVADACELVRQAAIGLQEAHEHGMVHRDIKPSNLILAKSPSKKSPPTLKILDLGLALLSEGLAPDQELTSTGQMMGTIDYMAPEQGSDTHHVDIRADIYSLGATLYRLLTGMAPFAGEKFDTPVKKILALATKEPVAVQTLCADVPPKLATVVHKMLAKDPAGRFATPEELAEALAPFCQGANLAALLEQGTAERSSTQSPVGDSPTHNQRSSPSADTAPTIDAARRSKVAPGQSRGGFPRWSFLAACCGGILVVLLGVIFYLETLKGTIRIEINDPDIKVALDESRATFQGAHDKHKIRVESGQHGLTITAGDLKFETDKFELRKGDTLRLSVKYLAGKVEVVDVASKKPLRIAQTQPPNSSTNLTGSALKFDGKDDFVLLPYVPYDFKSPLTFEAWVTPADHQEKVDEKQVQSIWSRQGCFVGLTHWGWVFYCHKRDVIRGRGEAGVRCHLVAQWDGQSCRLYVNGKSAASQDNSKMHEPAGILPRILGADGNWGGEATGNFFRGRIDEIRISNVPRYQGDFTPPDPSKPFAADAQTLALYHFDEGVGEELKDSSGNGRHGKIVGATWVRAARATAHNIAGWHGWPADAPKPAVAPFTAEQARKHQEEWAKYLGVPVEYENSIGMKFVLIPPGEFTMGSTPAAIEEALAASSGDKSWQAFIKSEAPQHKVILTQPYYLGLHEVTQAQFKKVMGRNPSHFAATGAGNDAVVGFDTSTYPVETVSWNDAAEFCANLSEQEKLKPFYFRSGETVKNLKGAGYRLPMEAEWEFACRAGTMTSYWIADKDKSLSEAAWIRLNSGGRSRAVGELPANPFSLHDTHGNVWEWVQDGWEPNYYGQFQEKPALDPSGSTSAGYRRVIRGGGWSDIASYCRASIRLAHGPSYHIYFIGFRVTLDIEAVKQSINAQAAKPIAGWHGWSKDAPAPAIAPFTAEQAKKHQKEWAEYLGVQLEYENSIGMKFVLIPPGEFTMGSTPAESEAATAVLQGEFWRKLIRSEAPQHKVILTQPIYLGIHEVTQAQYLQITGRNPSHFAATGEGKKAVAGLDTSTHPVEMLRYSDAVELCAKLCEKEKLSQFELGVRTGERVASKGAGIRLPTEAEWEFACRAGTTTKFWIGDQDEQLVVAGWILGNSGRQTHPVGKLNRNPFGLFDMHGNVWEWVQDLWEPNYYAQFQEKPAIDPSGGALGHPPVARGGGWVDPPCTCRSSARFSGTGVNNLMGLRVAMSLGAVKQAIKERQKTPATALSGWHGWPKNAPAPAVAPFDTQQAKKHQEEWAEYLGVPLEYENSIGMKFVFIPPGEFMMGSTEEEISAALVAAGKNEYWKERIPSEGSRHKVILTQPIYLGVYEVTQTQYEQVMRAKPSHFAASGLGKNAVNGLDTSMHPVEMVSWNDAAKFCAKLSEKEQLKPSYFRSKETFAILAGAGYQLPTEAQWEFACRAGTTTKYWTGDEDVSLVQAGWFTTNSGERTHAVGELKPNPLGVFDIHSNVWEWVQDWWEPTYYSQFQRGPALDPAGPDSTGSQRVLRGGDGLSHVSGCRASHRGSHDPSLRSHQLGFRVALPLDAVRVAIAERKTKSASVVPSTLPEPQASTGTIRSLPGPPSTLTPITDFREVHDISVEEMDTWVKNLPRGFVPASITRRAGEGQPRFSMVAIQDGKETEYQFFARVPFRDGESEFKRLSEAGHQLIAACTYKDGDEYFGATFWVPSRSPWLSRTGSLSAISDAIKTMKDAGFRPRSLHGAMVAEGFLYSLQTIGDDRMLWESNLKMEKQELHELVEQARAAGWRPDLLSAYVDEKSELRFVSVMVKDPEKAEWAFEMDLSSKTYAESLQRHRTQGFYPRAIAAYGDAETPLFAVTWLRYRLPETVPSKTDNDSPITPKPK